MSTAPSTLSLPTPPSTGAAVTWVRPRGWRGRLDPRELWAFRELGWVLALRDLRVRYKQTVLGGAWALLQPAAAMVVLNLFFGHGLGMSERVPGVPYAVFLYAGLLPWMLFVAGVNAAANSVVGNAHIVSKVYFPRLILPASALLGPIVDFALASSVLALIMAWYGVAPTAAVALTPLLVLSVLVATLGVGVTIAGLVVNFRDLRHALPFVMQMWLFATPVIYPSTLLPPRWSWVLQLNPVAGPIDAFRAAILGQPIDWTGWAVSTCVGAALLVTGVCTFARCERRFADVI